MIAKRTPPIGIGVSTNSCPDLRGPEVAEAVLACGGNSVELRIGRGHGWEPDGVSSVAATGVTVATIASSRTFGVDAIPGNDEDINQAVATGAWLRCFLDARYESNDAFVNLAHAQVAEVQRALGDKSAVIIEPHPGYASVCGVTKFCASTGASAVLDTLAIHQLGITMPLALFELGKATRSLHVKGFDRSDCEWRHRALAPGDLPDPATLAPAPNLAVVVVETRAGSQWRDLRLLSKWAGRA